MSFNHTICSTYQSAPSCPQKWQQVYGATTKGKTTYFILSKKYMFMILAIIR